MDRRAKVGVGAGIALDLAGIALVIFALQDGDWKVGAGLAMMLAGGWLITSSVRGGGRSPEATLRDAEGARSKWRPEPELRREPPRRVRMRPASKLTAVIWLLALTAAAGYAYITVFARIPPPPTRDMLDVTGVRVQATVHRREVRENASGRLRYVLYYNFSGPSGAAVRSSVNVPKTLFDRFEEGASLETIYLPEDPVVHYVPALTRPAYADRALLMAMVTAACLAFLLDHRRRRHHRLVRNGEAVAGLVENVRRRGGARAYDVTFRVKGRDARLSALERNRLRRNGDVVTVLYNPQDPAEAMPYHQAMYQAID